MVSDAKDDDWSIPCNDDTDDLEPPAEELEAMYALLESGGSLELDWKCPGRRQPSPPPAGGGGADAATAATNPGELTPEKETPTKNKDFDFMDEEKAPAMRVRAQNSTPKGSAKKKTANFAGVIDAMKKHRQPAAEGGATAAGAAAAATVATATTTTAAASTSSTTATTAATTSSTTPTSSPASAAASAPASAPTTPTTSASSAAATSKAKDGGGGS